MPSFTVVGSGLAGCLMAVYLAQRGYKVTLFERNDDMRDRPVPRGRSINLALSRRGINALQEVGIGDKLMELAIPMRGRMIHSPTGQLTFQPYGKNDQEAIYSISRNALNVALINLAETYPNVEVFFNHKCLGADLNRTTITLEDQITKEVKTVSAEMVVGADGAYSAIRDTMQVRTERFDYSQQFLSHGYKELTIPALPDGSHALDKNALHIWPRHDFMMIALPNLDGTFTCTLFFPHQGPMSFESLKNPEEVRRFFTLHFPDAVPIMPTLVEDFFHNPTGAMVTVRCAPWHYRGRFVLTGDAAHAVVPFYGQGMNASFEDCSVLNACMDMHGEDWPAVFEAYQSRRKRNTDVLSELAIANYLEMRDKVASPWFLMKKKLDNVLATLLPGVYLPLYTMVSFTLIPYADAVERAHKQDRILLMVGIGILLLPLLLAGWWVLRNLG
ncbi:MAG TPA: NAD(P)/FAD-dependent oxidoreductase [Acidobacteriota bacterium]|nr:NAD(P)/FAD-dependent oxidoreductase [Acidobacteriota bacterium]